MQVPAVRSFECIVASATEKTERIADDFAINKISRLKMLPMSAVYDFIVVVVVLLLLLLLLIIIFFSLINRMKSSLSSLSFFRYKRIRTEIEIKTHL